MPHVLIMTVLPDVARQGFPVSFFTTVRLTKFEGNNASLMTKPNVFPDVEPFNLGVKTNSTLSWELTVCSRLWSGVLMFTQEPFLIQEKTQISLVSYVQGPIKDSTCLQKRTITSTELFLHRFPWQTRIFYQYFALKCSPRIRSQV